MVVQAVVKANAYFVQERKICCWTAPILPAYNFSATMASTTSTYRLEAVVSLNFSAIENMPPISIKLHTQLILFQIQPETNEINNVKSDTFCVFCPTAQNFLLVGTYFQRIISPPQWPLPIGPSTHHFGAVASLKFLAIENMPPTFRPTSIMAKRLDG